MTELTLRQKDILEIVTREYIATAIPVGSGTVAGQLSVPISPATVRNEMAILEDLGYISQPHTSAGRVPTDKAYRFLVERMMESPDLALVPSERAMVLHQFHQVSLDVEQWMRLAAAMLAQTAQSTSIVTMPRSRECRFKHAELISVQELVTLLILVLQGGIVRQQMIAFPSPISQDMLSQIANHLNDLYHDASRREIRERTGGLTALEEKVTTHLLDIMDQIDRRDSTEIYRDGLIHILSQPEFTQADRLRCILEILEQRNLMDQVLAPARVSSGVQVIIGSESTLEQMRDYSMVLSSYGVEGSAIGVLGVMGPTRMRYGRAISAVRCIAGIMNTLLGDLYE
ncbi:MAG: heat-inducible transcriptional repressor HrcA [Chloroflexi bacterium]|nr:heat-inducible transcriptional repressor HrcA [Chloroflexota bacterium]MBU1748026.1 heat-inducible transcriptional repressor HrcA [Chloroflexota bacterium]MBU1877359.1 heat-inducible transcriptional repressor HrcA [Chloroflexota bacterium]